SITDITNRIIVTIVEEELQKALKHFNASNSELIHKINWSLLGDDTTFYNKELEPLKNGKVVSYKAGTKEMVATYSDYLWNKENNNPILLDEFGKADVHLKGIYDLHVYDSENNLIEVKENVINGFAAEEIINGRI